MANARGDASFAEFVRSHRLHYEVVPEGVVGRQGRMTVGFEVRMFALHDKGAQALPGCSKCWELAAGLRSIAESLLPRDEMPTRAEIEPFDPVLYDSKEVPGTDEVALAIRLFHSERYERPVDACEERCLKEIRQRLRALGIPEQ